MRLFYCPDITSLQLSKDESAHAIRVLRLKIGDEIDLIDGKGGKYKAIINDTRGKVCHFELCQTVTSSKPDLFYVHIAIAPTKNMDRMLWFVEKCTEIGIDEISFIKSARSERKVIKTDRLEKTAIQAIKQSLKTFLPKINPMVPLKDFLATARTSQDFIAHLADENRQSLKQLIQPKGNYCILIGPEGDFSEEEVALCINQGFLPVTLGEKRLRTETAGIVACHSLHLLNEESITN